MSLPKIVGIGSIVIFGVIGLLAVFKKPQEKEIVFDASKDKLQEIVVVEEKQQEEIKVEIKEEPSQEKVVLNEDELPEADIIDRLFAVDSSKLPIVETVSYTSRVPWLKGRPAWIADYASYYQTTRHFIARSLNRKADYFTQKVSFGDRFNVFKKDKNINFHMVIDLSRLKMWLYYVDSEANDKVLLKTYKVGLGRKEAKRSSGYLTPIGKYSLGEKVAIYKPGTMGFFQEEKTEMIQVFGTRWIPFDKEVENCSEAAKGLGLHGAPWSKTANGELTEDISKIGKYDSDGCIRLASTDIEEIFAIVISKPTTIELVKDFYDSELLKEDRSKK